MRYQDWQKRLWSEMHACRYEPWGWGQFDCVRFAARCVDAMVVDAQYSELVAGLYTDARSALRLVMRSGGLEALLEKHLHVTPGPRAHARHGDLVSIDAETGPAVGVCAIDKIAFAHCPGGVIYLPLALGRYSFRVD